MRAAIVHDWFQGYHGAERTVDAMRAGLFAPGNEPDVFTFHAAHELLPPPLSAAILRESRLARLPGLRQRAHDPGRWRLLLPYMPHFFSTLDLRNYDLVISSSHACAVNVRPRGDALHVCYCYTPMRYAWMPETERERVSGPARIGLRAFRSRLRRLDLEASRRPDLYIAISTAVQDRIKRFYGRDAEVIHPPVDTADLQPDEAKEPGRFLWVNRLVSYKRPDVVVDAFRELPYRLTMVGVGPLEHRLRPLPPNVELRGWVSRAELASLYARASGFVHVGEEDFGISMVEALAAGTPVLAVEAGGARDIVRPDVDGVLIRSGDVEAVREGIHRLATGSWSAPLLAERAQEFSRERFLARLASAIRASGEARAGSSTGRRSRRGGPISVVP